MYKKQPNNIVDAIYISLLIANIAFYDIKIVFITTQLLAIIYSIIRIVHDRKISKTLVFLFLWGTIFIFYCILSTIWSSEKNITGISSIISIAQVFLMMLSIAYYCSKDKNINKLTNFFIIAAIVLSIRFFATIPPQQWGNETRLSKDTIFGSNEPAIAMAYASVLLVLKTIKQKQNKMKIAYIICILFLMTVAMLTGTKKSLLILTIGASLMLLLNSRSASKIIKRTVIIISLIATGALLIFNVPLLYNSIGYRIDLFISGVTGDTTTKESTVMRSKFIEHSFEVYKNNPIIGIGQDGYRYANIYEKSYSHCNYTELLANLGTIGFILFYSIYLYAYNQAKKQKILNIVAPIIITMLIADFAAVTYSMEIQYILFGLIYGVLQKGKTANDII